MEIFLLLLMPALLVVLWLAATAAVAYQARQRGYSFFLWFIAQIIMLNPVIFLVVLALMPNRKRKILRDEFRAELDAKLAACSGSRLLPSVATAVPSSAGSTMPAERSLGDMPTMAPPERSLGDEETRG